MLEPTYERIRHALSEKIKKDAPATLSIGVDGWSQFHSGYMGMNCHYLDKEWQRVVFNLACAPFEESHTGENIYRKIKSVLTDWDIFEQAKKGVNLRDNASNMVSLETNCLKFLSF